ncbi:MAG: sigma-70 family RNA polymerase sigma factor [Candidatus Gottesmanbacteria bacterium]
MDDAKLISRILARDERALHEFYVAYSPKLRRFIQTKVQNPNDCEDIFQDTLYAFLDAIRDFQGSCQMNTFLQSICNHKIIDYYRKKKLRNIVFSQFPEVDGLISPLLNPEEALDEIVLREELHKTLNKLLPQYKLVLYARYILNMPVVEIAKKFATTLKGAESMLFRAKKAFAKNHEHV